MKSRSFTKVLAGVIAGAGFLFASGAFAIVADLTPMMDNTIYDGILDGEDFTDNTCGAGNSAYIGNQQNGFSRRALLKFDISQIPPGSTINSVTLTIDIDRAGDNQDAPATVHPVDIPWGEGIQDCREVAGGGRGIQADPGDATWLDAEFQQTAWGASGGDYGPASATAILPTRGPGVWTDNTPGDGLVQDVQTWLDNPLANNGWIILGDETRSPSSRRFDTREGGTPPVLTVDYTPVGNTFACCLAVPEGACQVFIVGDEASCTGQGGTVFPDPLCTPNPCPQPVGACCNLDESCSDGVSAAECLAGGGFFNGDGSLCSDNQVDCGLEPFVDPLPWPVPEAQPVSGTLGGEASYEITMSQFGQQLHRDLPDTNVWGYAGSYPGPTLEATFGKPISVQFNNDLPGDGHYLTVDTCPHGPNYWRESSITSIHLHGGHVPARFDGQPELTFFPGGFDTYEYPNNQDAATMWYHDHALGITRLNVYMGLAAYYLLRPDCALTPDHPECNGSLPPKAYEVPAVIQDRSFDENGQLDYPLTIQGGGFFGDKVLVNGKVWPYLNVDQGKYRFRFLNGSQARSYTLRLENLADPAAVIPFTLIGTDTGLTSAPIDINTIHMVPAERFDVVIDFENFPGGTEIVLRNDDDATLPNVMKFIVQGGQPGYTMQLPTTLVPVDPIPENESAGTRYFNLIQVDEQCAGKEWLVQSLDGPDPATATVLGEHWDDIDAFPVLGTTEIWEFINASSLMHPMHVHLVKFQVLDRCPLDGGQCETLAPHEANTWKDTVSVPAATRVRVIMRFEDYPGKFPIHCHILDHEDHEMMRQFQTTSDICDLDGQCELGEDGISCADCGWPADPNADPVSGAFCGNKLCETGDGEDFFTCPQDCNGKKKGGGAFNCGSTDPTDPGYKCGFELDLDTGKPIFNSVLFDGCTTGGYFCRVAPRVVATCGDALCEGQEQVPGPGFCEVDCGPACQITEQPEATCDDGIDNDCDNLTDAADPDCNGNIGEQGFCFDGVDNDNDGFTDCADTDCTGETNGSCLTGQPGICSAGTYTCNGAGGVPEPECVQDNQPSAEICTDGLDNDCNGLPDCNDSVCSDDPACQVDCSDITDRGICRDTAGCEWVGGGKNGMCQPVSSGQCTDNDGDGYGNPGDVSCTSGAAEDCDDANAEVNPGAIEGPPGDATCSDGTDNDCDGLSDMDDPDCMSQGCSAYPDEASCEADETCRWKKKDMVCLPR